MNLPAQRTSAELNSADIGRDYVAMSISPLEYAPYLHHEGSTTIGYAGVATTPQGLITVARLAHYDTETSYYMMRNWLMPTAEICLPESRYYSGEMLDAITTQIGCNEAIALFQLEDEGRGDIRISLAARKALGEIAIEQKAMAGLSPSARELRVIERRMGRDRLAARKAFGEKNYEALVVGSALMLRLFETPTHPQISTHNHSTITR